MKFKRTERYEPIVMTPRKVANGTRRVVKRATQLAIDYPLFSDQLEQPEEFNPMAEQQRRQQLQNASEQRMRAHNSRVWRESRRDYFRATQAQQRAIKKAWAEWRGPMTCGNFRYVVDVHTGVMEARSRKFRMDQAEIARRIASLPCPLSLSF